MTEVLLLFLLWLGADGTWGRVAAVPPFWPGWDWRCKEKCGDIPHLLLRAGIGRRRERPFPTRAMHFSFPCTINPFKKSTPYLNFFFFRQQLLLLCFPNPILLHCFLSRLLLWEGRHPLTMLVQSCYYAVTQ